MWIHSETHTRPDKNIQSVTSPSLMFVLTYLCVEDESGKVHCSLVMRKSQAAPLNYITIPRMELVTATLSVNISVILRKVSNILDR